MTFLHKLGTVLSTVAKGLFLFLLHFWLSFPDSSPLSQTKGIKKKKKCVHHEGHDAAICGQSAKNGKSTDKMTRPVFSTWFQQVPENTVCLEAF